MITGCSDCEDYTCACDVMECIETLRLGTISLNNTQVYIHVLKANGNEYIQAVTSSGSGEVVLDMIEPDKSFYNSFDGLYLVSVVRGGYFCDEDKLTVTAVGGTFTQAGFYIKKNSGVSYTSQHLQV